MPTISKYDHYNKTTKNSTQTANMIQGVLVDDIVLSVSPAVRSWI